MMRKDKIPPTSVDIKGFPQVFLTHHRTFDVPPWSSLTPWAFPEGFSGFAGFPKGEVQGVSFLLIDLDASSGLHLFHVPLREFAIVSKFLDREKDIPIALVGVSL